MELSKKQIEKRSQIIEDMIISVMEGHNVHDATRHPVTREMAEHIVEGHLCDGSKLKIINAMAAAWA